MLQLILQLLFFIHLSFLYMLNNVREDTAIVMASNIVLLLSHLLSLMIYSKYYCILNDVHEFASGIKKRINRILFFFLYSNYWNTLLPFSSHHYFAI